MTTQKMSSYILILTLAALAILASSKSDRLSLPQSVIKVLASREMRHHHFLWHNVRENWNRLTPEAQQEIRDLGWEPPRPSRRYENGSTIAVTDNDSGEDFLYMHRQMIIKVNKILADNNEPYGKIQGWTKLPGPGDEEWPITEGYIIPNATGRTATVQRWKSEEFYNETIKPMEETLTNYTNLRNMTLGEFGSRIESTLHGWYHLRYSSESPYGYRPTVVEGLPEIDTKWDDPRYDWLVDSYGSAVNPIFWMLHGWVDDRIEEWRKANGLTSIKWKGTWEGGPMSKVKFMWNKKEKLGSLRGSNMAVNEGEDTEEVEEDVMQQVARIFAHEGFESSFADPVYLEPLKPVC